MPRSSCDVCEDHGFITRAGRRWAEATVCTCRQPCPDCGGEGRRIRRLENGRTYVMECDCTGLQRRVRLYCHARIPAKYHGKTVESFGGELSGAQSAAKVWFLENQDRIRPGAQGVMLVGPPGIGKTHLVCGLFRYLTLEHGQACRYVDSFQLLEELKATFEAGTGSSALMEEVSGVPILALDELGKTRPSGWQLEVLDQIVSRRYDGGLTTFVTSNYGLRREGPPREGSLRVEDTLEDRVGPRIFSRLMEMCRPFAVDGPDRRLAGGR